MPLVVYSSGGLAVSFGGVIWQDQKAVESSANHWSGSGQRIGSVDSGATIALLVSTSSSQLLPDRSPDPPPNYCQQRPRQQCPEDQKNQQDHTSTDDSALGQCLRLIGHKAPTGNQGHWVMGDSSSKTPVVIWWQEGFPSKEARSYALGA